MFGPELELVSAETILGLTRRRWLQVGIVTLEVILLVIMIWLTPTQPMVPTLWAMMVLNPIILAAFFSWCQYDFEHWSPGRSFVSNSLLLLEITGHLLAIFFWVLQQVDVLSSTVGGALALTSSLLSLIVLFLGGLVFLGYAHLSEKSKASPQKADSSGSEPLLKPPGLV